MVSRFKLVIAVNLLLVSCITFGASIKKTAKNNKKLKEIVPDSVKVNVYASPSLFIHQYLMFEKAKHRMLERQRMYLTNVFIRAFQKRFSRLANKGKLDLALEEQKYLRERLKLPQFFGVAPKRLTHQAIFVQNNN